MEILQVIDDNTPEETQLFYLELFSPTNGSTLATDHNSTRSWIRVAASDNPHGVFRVNGRQHYAVDEGDNVSIVIERRYGTHGIVEVKYQLFGNDNHDVSLDGRNDNNGGLFIYSWNFLLSWVCAILP